MLGPTEWKNLNTTYKNKKSGHNIYNLSSQNHYHTGKAESNMLSVVHVIKQQYTREINRLTIYKKYYHKRKKTH